jgi:hypothetical protein
LSKPFLLVCTRFDENTKAYQISKFPKIRDLERPGIIKIEGSECVDDSDTEHNADFDIFKVYTV